jgi:hypothetical protein
MPCASHRIGTGSILILEAWNNSPKTTKTPCDLNKGYSFDFGLFDFKAQVV